MNIQSLPDDFDPLATHVPAPIGRQQVQQPSQAAPAPAPLQEAPVETTLAETNSAYYGVHTDLPSLMQFYPFDKASIRPYGLSEMFKLGAATKGGKIRYIVEAVCATVDRPMMTMALMDFWFAAYWLRTMSYPKTPLTLTWHCEDEKHYRDVAVELVSRDTLKNTLTVTNTDIKINVLDSMALRPIATRLHELGIMLAAPSVQDFLERVEAGDDWDDQFNFMVDVAVYLNPTHGRKLADRVLFLQRLETSPNGMEIMSLIHDAKEIIDKAGVSEEFHPVCKHCKTKTAEPVLVEVDLLTFFPFRV